MREPGLDVGLIYTRRSDYYISVDHRKVVGADGLLRHVTDVGLKYYKVNRQISVEALCDLWGITLERLDVVMAPFWRGTRKRLGE